MSIGYRRGDTRKLARCDEQEVRIHLADTFVAAAFDDTKWLPALQLFADATGSSIGQLIGIGKAWALQFNMDTSGDPDMNDQIGSIGGYDPGSNFRVAVAVGAQPLQIAYEREYRAMVPTLTTEAYLDACRQYQISFGCQTNLYNDGRGLIGLAMLRSDRDGITTLAQRRLFSQIAPHVRSAVTTQRMLAEDAAKLIEGMLDAMTCAAFICDVTLRVIGRTPATDVLLSDRRLRIRNERLSTSSIDGTRTLREAVGAMLTGEVLSPRKSIVVRDDCARAFILDIVPLPRRASSLYNEPLALVIAREAPRDDNTAIELLRIAFGLSPSEAEITIAMGKGLSRETIAEARGVTVGTVRSQLKAIFAKLNFNRESELVAWVNRLY